MRHLPAFPLVAASVLAALVAQAAPEVSLTPGRATIHNEHVVVVCDLHRGTYDVVDLGSRQVAVRGARAEAAGVSSAAEGLTRTATAGACSDELGAGKRLLIECAGKGAPTLLLEFRIYAERPFLVLRAGIRNTTKSIIHLKQFRPLAGGDLFAEGGAKTDWRTLNAPSGAGQTQVTRDEIRMSPNDLLITFEQHGVRRSVVLGGLKTSEFPKSAGIGPDGGPAGARSATLARILPGARLAAYVACGDPAQYAVGGPEKLTPVQGQPFNWSSPIPETTLNSLLFDNVAVQLVAAGLDPAKRYAVGLAWWDFNDDERVESIVVTGADGRPLTLIAQHKLPAFANRGQYPEQIAAVVPATAYADGKLRVSIRKDGGKSNAVVSEVWLWEIGAGELPQNWRDGHTVGKYAEGLPSKAMLEASDPVGKRVDPGTTYLPADSFYLDCSTASPFAALEQYGWQLRLANHANPNPYDFPTVCAWYAGVWNTPGAQNHPDKSKYKIATTPGLVEEIQQAGRLGFLKYSRLAGRLVPDNYTPNNPQGWWDDAHWQKEGFYVAPYETSQKWGKAMQAAGGLAITYFQAPMLSDDFRKAHSEMLIGHDPAKPFDYTNKAAQTHLRQVYAAMRGGVSGMMFDYCDELWYNSASAGGFEDPYATAATYYRNCLRMAKEGLGPISWIHERSIGGPPADLALGFADSQRTSGDTDRIDPAMISRSGLRWYKNRVVLAYDMDSKEMTHSWQVPGYTGSDEDGRRMMLTMAYVAASRLLLANSLRDLKPEALRDLEHTFPYHTAPKSARPVDAFAHEGWPRVYDFEVTPKWHQVTLFNNAEPSREETITAPLSGDTAEGALGLDAKKQYHVYDFWNDRYAGCLKGSEMLAERLRPGEARMLSVHEVEAGPQFIATNRHLMQGYLDLARYPTWDARKLELAGAAKVVGGEKYKVIVALNGYRPVKASAGCKVEALDGGKLAVLSIGRATNETVEWWVGFGR